MTRAPTLTLADHVEERIRVRRYNRTVRAICGAIAAAGVAVAGGVCLPGIQQQRRQLELVDDQAHFEAMPPNVMLPAAMLSTFRGLAVHILWNRAEELKQEGKYHELQQLSDWICRLQPRYPKVWENAAWNMAYNISVGTFTPQERWHWVSAGANLLRDQGLRYNPKTINIYYQLAWTYLHKMGDFMDDQHWAYKRNVAVDMERTLGQPPVDIEGSEAVDAMREIAQAAQAIRKLGPLERPESLRLYIEQDDQQPSMGDVVRRLDEIGLQPDGQLLDYVARYGRRDLTVGDLLIGTPEDERRTRFRALMADEKLEPARRRLLAAVRAQQLKKQHKLDPEFMAEIMERYGPLDWRSTYSHGMYWAALGVRECQDVIGLDENVEMNVNRFMQFALRDLAERGRVVLEPDFDDPFNSFIAQLPESAFIDQAHELTLKQAEALRAGEDPEKYYREGPAGRLFKSGHVNFLHQAVRTLFFEGRRERARFYYDYLRDNYKEPDGSTKMQYVQPLEDFVMQDYIEDVDSFKTGPAIINTMLEGWLLHLAYERPRPAQVRYKLAEDAYKRYMETKKTDPNERRQLPPWPEMRADAVRRFMLDYRAARRLDQEVMMKHRVWETLGGPSGIDVTTTLDTYRDIEAGLRQRLADHDPPLDFDVAFPKPDGLEEYEARRDREKSEVEQKIQEGEKR
jgi:hypothetical protein